MSSSHYETLGVPRDATPEDIKAARRRRARHAHPDVGGSDEEMQRVNHAYEVLIDPKRRATYDSTGDDRRDPPPIEIEARQVLRQLIEKAIENDENIVEVVRRQAHRATANLDGVVTKERRTITRLEKRRARISTKAGAENLAHQVIDARISRAMETIAQAERLRLVNKCLGVMIDAYSDDEQALTSPDACAFAWRRAFTPEAGI